MKVPLSKIVAFVSNVTFDLFNVWMRTITSTEEKSWLWVTMQTNKRDSVWRNGPSDLNFKNKCYNKKETIY